MLSRVRPLELFLHHFQLPLLTTVFPRFFPIREGRLVMRERTADVGLPCRMNPLPANLLVEKDVRDLVVLDRWPAHRSHLA